jgi:cyanate permease
MPLHSSTAWAVSIVFAMIAVCFYGLSAWLSDAYVEHGWSDGSAGALLAVVQAVTVPTGLAIPWLADRWGSRRLYLGVGAGVQMLGLLGVQLAPGGAWLWSSRRSSKTAGVRVEAQKVVAGADATAPAPFAFQYSFSAPCTFAM